MPTSRIASSTRSWCGRNPHGAPVMSRVSDTSAEAEAVRLAALRARSPEARLRDALEFSEMMHAVALARLRELHPARSKVELAFLVANDSSDGTSR